MSQAPTGLDRSYVFDGESIDSSRTLPRKESLPAVSCLRISPTAIELRARVHELIRSNLFRLVNRAREIAAIRPAPRATIAELSEAIPILFELLLRELRPAPSNAPGGFGSRDDWSFPLTVSLSVSQVIHDYVAVRFTIAELAAEVTEDASPAELARVNHCVAEATAQIEAGYARRHERALAADATEDIGNLVHELRNRISTAMLAFSLIHREGQLRGRPAAILRRSLEAMTEHIARARLDVRARITSFKKETISISDLLEAISIVAAAEAQTLGLELKVDVPDRELIVEGDSLLIEDAIVNLLRNAFRHTRPHGCVALRASSADGLVKIEVADQCGGIPEDVALNDLFDRFEQRGVDRSGLGLGLTISRRGVEASGGTIAVRNLEDGCVFALALPHR